MLRHLRMTPPKESATAGRAPRWLMWMQPLYHYTAPHRRPRRGECDTICRCKFPLFTLCSPQLSPFDSGDDGLAATSAPSQSNNGGGGGANNNNNNNGVAATSSSDDATATSSSSSSSSLPLTQRRLWRRHAAACFAAPLGSTSGALPPHILPNKPACYRCEVCDGFQRGSRCIQHVEDEAPNNLHTIDAATRPSTTPTSATQGQTHGVAKCCSSGCDDDDACDDDDDDDDDAWDGHPTSTDIANSIMDDLELAELRYINPYAVEVAGRYPLSSWSRKLARQMQAQVRRSNLSVDLSHTRTSLHDTSATHMTLYQDWLQQQLHKKKMHATRRSQPERTTYLRDRLHLVERGAYLARFAVSAYGLPYELGYFGSVRGIMKLQAKPHRRYTCATSEEQMDSMRRMLVGSGSSSSSSSPLLEFAMSRYSLRVGQPSFALVLDHAQRRVVLTFRGTMTLADAIVDVMEGYVEVDLHHPETPLAVQVGSAKHLVPIHALSSAEAQRVRRWTNNSNNKSKTPSTSSSSSSSGEELRTRIPLGFYEAATEAATHVLPALHEIYQHYSDYELNITGHSLGGILATVFHLLYCIPNNNNNNNMAAVGGFPRVCTVALAPAPCVEVKALAKIHALLAEDKRRRGSELVSFVYGSDIVARLQVRSIRSLLMPTPTPTPSPSIATSSSSAVVPTNAMPNTRAMPSDAQLPELALPGLVLNVPHALKRCCFEVEEQAAWRTQIVADVASITHHFPLHYLRSLNSLEAYYRKRLVELGNDDG